jgi:hypothetical protein
VERHRRRGRWLEEVPATRARGRANVAHRVRWFLRSLRSLVRKPFELRYGVEGKTRREATSIAELAAALGVLGTIGGLILLIGGYDRGLGAVAFTAVGMLLMFFGFRNLESKD